MTTAVAPIAVALDTSDLAVAAAVAAAVGRQVRALKVGLQLFTAEGPAAVEKLRAGSPGTEIMLDLKLHDIPATVAGAARSLQPLAPEILTVHALGGAEMIRQAVEALPATQVAAVTVLTSHTETDLDRLGIAGPAMEAVRRLAVLAVTAGARALVCSPREVAAVRAEVGPDVRLVIPGVRPAGASTDDQARVATPAAAIAAGADLLVVGRPITGAPDPAAALAGIAAELPTAT
jgi:orotidine-5'-phosphate decarboxylase